jgi:hypothetical protein
MRAAFNLNHQLTADRVQRLSGALRYAKGFRVSGQSQAATSFSPKSLSSRNSSAGIAGYCKLE